MSVSGKPWGPYLLVAAGTAAGLGLIAFGVATWVGGAVIGFALVAGAALRLIVPDDRAGLLGVRTRRMDAFVLLLLGAALVAGSLSLLLRLHST
ncbi:MULTISPECIES: DUF3017 domain-containing protein [Microtetraspora]|uniref:DUF3017 domain-containing protein n=1 Tax=Microtetraspora glauca TaxID=1996 RepID=A0ABV3G737_MICGL|nr:DUF3017 domain-containing protein [Microtetraspora sp. AC03309]MCC5580995.1 DUF3017 domain-containing protein [Microtetraspora sp. AC03309]